ncbi:DUF4214 domain-containing protein [Asticcacaulis benevestitus]|uniref:DUF4214 domain-containing protein n=1 Tax=Asticcacaulis benevestitus DSM 16100 = ATCC BAA-896 TaxID=1121022 RepID=V4P1F6_9CAUL|nr:DUF4214 domain-containing protein [Asticcacaulis benevestitus]ESQ87827.1 hypothetical protein ABENE_16880 [Asticcacaulis benevestitus DSM 16100 = ATCC BAA-896]
MPYTTTAQKQMRALRRAAMSLGYSTAVHDAVVAAGGSKGWVGTEAVDLIKDHYAGDRFPPNAQAGVNQLVDDLQGNIQEVWMYEGPKGASVLIFKATTGYTLLIDGVDAGNGEGMRDMMDIARQGTGLPSGQLEDVNTAISLYKSSHGVPTLNFEAVVGQSHGAAVAADYARQSPTTVGMLELYEPQGTLFRGAVDPVAQYGIPVEIATTSSDFLNGGSNSTGLVGDGRLWPTLVGMGNLLWNDLVAGNMTQMPDLTPDSTFAWNETRDPGFFSHTYDTLFPQLASLYPNAMAQSGWTTPTWTANRGKHLLWDSRYRPVENGNSQYRSVRPDEVPNRLKANIYAAIADSLAGHKFNRVGTVGVYVTTDAGSGKTQVSGDFTFQSETDPNVKIIDHVTFVVITANLVTSGSGNANFYADFLKADESSIRSTIEVRGLHNTVYTSETTAYGGSVEAVAGDGSRVKVVASMGAGGSDEKVQVETIDVRSGAPAIFSQFVRGLGSTIADVLVPNNKIGSTVTNVLITPLLDIFANSISTMGPNSDGAAIVRNAGNAVSAQYGEGFRAAVNDQIKGSLSSYLTAELGEAMGLSGFGAQLYNQVGSSVFGQVLQNVQTSQASIFKGWDFKKVFTKDGWTGVNGNLIGTAITSFFASKLASAVVRPETQAAILLSSLGSSFGQIVMTSAAGAGVTGLGVIGSTATMLAGGLASVFGKVIASFMAPGIGIIIGQILGTMIGNLFGPKKPRTPAATAETILQVPYAKYELGAAVASNGGNLDLVTYMASSARDVLNEIIGQITYGDDKSYVSNLNGTSTNQTYGHSGGQIYYKINGVRTDVASADIAIERGTLLAIRNTKVVGGNLFYKRAILNSKAENLVTLTADMNVANEYSSYNQYRTYINGLIAQKPHDTFAATWAITLSKAAELNLNQFATSDFYGGLGGFLTSFGVAKAESKVHFEDFQVKAVSGGGMRIGLDTVVTTTDTKSAAAKIYRLYRALLNRAPDGFGMNDYTNLLELGRKTLKDIAADILSSQEFVNRVGANLSDWDFIVQLYATVFNRTASSGEIQSWINTLNSGVTRAEVATGFTESAENVTRLAAPVQAGLSYTSHKNENFFATLPQATGWNDAVLIDQVTKVGMVSSTGTVGAGNDFVDLSGSATAVTINDQSGGDNVILGSSAADVLKGGSGFDWIVGNGGNDEIWGYDGNDILISLTGNANVYGGAGDDYLTGAGAYGGAGNDTLVGGAGYNTLLGHDGDDLFLMAKDFSINWYNGGDWGVNSDPNGRDTVSADRIDVGVSFDMDIRPSTWDTSGDAALSNPAARLLAVYSLASNQWLTSMHTASIENGTGSQFADRFYGTVGDNVLKGLAGDDKLFGRDGNDILEGGAGADQLAGDAGIDILSYESSTEGVSANLTTGQAFGGDAVGDTWTGIEALRGSKLADELKGDGNQNTIQGLAGDDWIVATGNGPVTQTYTTGYNYYRDVPILVPNGWTGGDIYDGGLGVDTVDYSEASAGITANLGSYTETTASPGSGSSGLALGHSYINIENIVGTSYADNLSAGTGAHTFEGGKGNDTLNGGAGGDTYLFSRGDGVDSIAETNTDNNALSFAGDIKYSDLYIESAGGSSGWLNVGIRGTADKVAVASNFATLTKNRLKTLAIGGASQLDIGQITFQVSGGTDGNNTLNGTNNNDWIFAFNGNDIITGYGTNWEDSGNLIIGGLGDDTISTSAGDDQFAYDRGDGFDTITDTGGEDTIAFGATAKAEDVIYQVVGNDLFVGLKDSQNSALMASQVADKIKIVDGGVKYLVHNTIDHYAGDSEHGFWIIATENYDSISLNTVEYVLAGGTSIDLRKLDIAWTNAETWNYQQVYPIALDLNGDGLNLSTVDSSEVVVKTAGGGLSKLAWVGPTDGFLAVDRDGDGKINKLSEISFTQDKTGATSDLEGLKTWDTNGDGLLNSSDANFNKILLWVDANQNGRSTTRELRTLTQAGIVAIDLNGVATGYTADMGIDSFVQNNMKFIWADGSQGNAYDVALARRVLGSEGLYAGEYQAEWGASNSDGTLGRLSNDPKTAAKAARIAAKKGLLDKIGASYQEVKAKAQVDFSDTDAVDAKVAKRWAKMDKSAQAAWLSGQVVQTDASVIAVSAKRALQTTSEVAQQATRDLQNSAYSHARASVSAGLGLDTAGNGASAATGSTAYSQGASELGGLSVTASAPDLTVAGFTTAGASSQAQAWWRSETQNDSAYRSSNLSSVLSAMETATPDQGRGQPSDYAMAQQQLLLRQSMAAFGGASGGSPAVWNRDASSAVALAASTGLRAQSQSGFASAVA